MVERVRAEGNRTSFREVGAEATMARQHSVLLLLLKDGAIWHRTPDILWIKVDDFGQAKQEKQAITGKSLQCQGAKANAKRKPLHYLRSVSISVQSLQYCILYTSVD